MPKKKISKSTSKKVSSRSTVKHTDDHSFLIIVGGGFLIIMILVIFLSNQASVSRAVMSKMKTPQVMAQKDELVTISNFVYAPETVTVKAGTKVTWLNSDAVEHSIVADDGTFDTGVITPGEKGSYTFTKAGTYVYHCGIHPSMTGTVVVE